MNASEYTFVAKDLSKLQISYTLLEKVFNVMSAKLAALGMSTAYLDRFEKAFQANTMRVIPKTIIEMVGNIQNLRKIVLKVIETLSFISELSTSTVEHVVNRVIALVHDRKEGISLACTELKS